MTTLIWAVDGLDSEYVHEQSLMQELSPQGLYQDLTGANALFTYRVWPAIWTGENGGASEFEESARFYPDRDPIWDRYSAVVALAPWIDGLYSRNQTEFDPDYRESAGPRDRIDRQFRKYWKVFHDFVGGQAEIGVFGTRLPDILGHKDQNPERIDEIIAEITEMVEKMAIHPEIDDYLVVSDHGFKWKKFGGCPSGNNAHSRHATLATSFAGDYSQMSDFIENWTDDLDETLRKTRLEALGYT